MKISKTTRGFINVIEGDRLKSYAPGSFDVDNPPEDVHSDVINLAKEVWTDQLIDSWNNFESYGDIEQWRQSFKVPTYKLEIELEERDLMATVQSIIDQSEKSVRIGWKKSPTVRRMSQTVLGLASHPDIALTAEDLDDIFKSADLREL